PVTIAVLPAKRPAVAAGAGSGMRVILFGRRCCSGGRAAGGRAGAGAASPLGDGAVGVPPDGVAPPVSFAGPLADVVLVDLDAEARPGGDGDVPGGVGERAGFREVVEQVVGDVVVNAEALLLDEGVVGAGVELQAGGERDGPERAVQRDGGVVGLRHGGDAAGLADAAGV